MHSRNPDAEELMWILLYIHADDISLVCDNSESLRAATLMDVTFVQWGLTISTKKTKVLVVGKDAAEQSTNAVITIRGEVLEVVSHFKYLGSMFTSDGMLDTEIAHRVAVVQVMPLPGSIKQKSGHQKPCPCPPSFSSCKPLS